MQNSSQQKKQLQEHYKELYGKRPYYGWSSEKLESLIAEAAGNTKPKEEPKEEPQFTKRELNPAKFQEGDIVRHKLKGDKFKVEDIKDGLVGRKVNNRDPYLYYRPEELVLWND